MLYFLYLFFFCLNFVCLIFDCCVLDLFLTTGLNCLWPWYFCLVFFSLNLGHLIQNQSTCHRSNSFCKNSIICKLFIWVCAIIAVLYHKRGTAKPVAYYSWKNEQALLQPDNSDIITATAVSVSSSDKGTVTTWISLNLWHHNVWLNHEVNLSSTNVQIQSDIPAGFSKTEQCSVGSCLSYVLICLQASWNYRVFPHFQHCKHWC